MEAFAPRAARRSARGGKGDVSESNSLWTSRNSSYVATPLLCGEHLYWVDDHGIAWCVNAASGAIVYRAARRRPANGGTARLRLAGSRQGSEFSSSPVGTERSSSPASPSFKLLAQNRFGGDDTDFNATPAVSDGELFLRSNHNLYCVSAAEVGPTHILEFPMFRFRPWFLFGVICAVRRGGRRRADLPNVRRKGTTIAKRKALPAATTTMAKKVRRVADARAGPPNPLMEALDTNRDGMLSAEEIANAPASLKKLDKNGDGKLTSDELRPTRRRGGRGGNFGPGRDAARSGRTG